MRFLKIIAVLVFLTSCSNKSNDKKPLTFNEDKEAIVIATMSIEEDWSLAAKLLLNANDKEAVAATFISKKPFPEKDELPFYAITEINDEVRSLKNDLGNKGLSDYAGRFLLGLSLEKFETVSCSFDDAVAASLKDNYYFDSIMFNSAISNLWKKRDLKYIAPSMKKVNSGNYSFAVFSPAAISSTTYGGRNTTMFVHEAVDFKNNNILEFSVENGEVIYIGDIVFSWKDTNTNDIRELEVKVNDNFESIKTNLPQELANKLEKRLLQSSDSIKVKKVTISNASQGVFDTERYAKIVIQ